MRVQRRERGRRRRVPRRAACRSSGSPTRSRRRSRAVDGAAARDLDELVEADAEARAARPSGGRPGRMSVAIAILGLALPDPHPRGRPLLRRARRRHAPAAASTSASRRRSSKTTRNGIEYGDRRDPARRLREDPGDAPAGAGRRRRVLRAGAAASDPSSSARVQRLKRALAAGDDAAARRARWTSSSGSAATGRRRGVRRAGVQELRDGLGADAYWRQRHVEAGRRDPRRARRRTSSSPSSSSPCLFLTGRRQGDDDGRPACSPARPAAAIGLRPGDRIVAVNGVRVGRRPTSPTRDRGVEAASRVTLVVRRGAQRVTLGPVQPADGSTAPTGSASSSAASSSASASRAWQSRQADRHRHEGDRQVARPARPRPGPQGHLEPGRDRRRRSSAGARAGRADTTSGCSGSSASRSRCSTCCRCCRSTAATSRSRSSRAIRGRAVAREVYERVSVVGIALVLLLFFDRALERRRPPRRRLSRPAARQSQPVGG